jgi:hypothetical protein
MVAAFAVARHLVLEARHRFPIGSFVTADLPSCSAAIDAFASVISCPPALLA